MKFDQGTMTVYGRGYDDFELFSIGAPQGVLFVTRMKEKTGVWWG
jgi:hypothetical protein